MFLAPSALVTTLYYLTILRRVDYPHYFYAFTMQDCIGLHIERPSLSLDNVKAG